MNQPKVIEAGEYKIYLYSKPAPIEERKNEDSSGYCVVNNSEALFIVSDGMGGHQSGGKASEMIVKTLIKAFASSASIRGTATRSTSQGSSIIDGIEKAQKKVRGLKVGAGATLVVAEVRKHKLRFYACGDSIGVLLGAKGKTHFRTIEHSIVGFGVESGFIEADSEAAERNSHILLNGIGFEKPKIEMSLYVPLKKRDIIYLASDGLTDHMAIEDLSKIHESGSFQDNFQAVIDLVLKRMEETQQFDDLTILAAVRVPGRYSGRDAV